MDPLHILQFSMISRIINESTSYMNHPYIIVFVLLYGIYKIMPYSCHEYIENEFKIWFFDLNNEASIIIPYHIKTYSSGFSSKPVEKTLYSERFQAINHYILKSQMYKLFSLIEIMNSENSKYFEGNSNYILLPKYNQKIKICEKQDIYFEILLEKKMDSGDNKKENNTESQMLSKKYIYKISKKGKENIQCINIFLEKIVKEYTDEILNKTIQMVFEYQKVIKDDDDRILTLFNETPFKTNKSFDNIFFEGKSEFIEYISQFSIKTPSDQRKHIQSKYERVGIPYKSVILLHGDPGCGKTSLVKSTIGFTGRHCILVSWSKIHTFNDFISLFRPLKINNKTYYSNELILVFEDFDANDNNIIKKRKIAKENSADNHENDSISSSSYLLEDNIKAKLMNDLKINPLYKLEDEITLEFILNVLDGIVELFDIIVFFTTNNIDIIDPALKRSGRIDRIINMKKATPSIIKEMLAHHYNLCENEMKYYEDTINNIPLYKYSYSDISQICNSSHTIDDCLLIITKI
jgi:ATP-dependent 26S proteasome regulatory subunit